METKAGKIHDSQTPPPAVKGDLERLNGVFIFRKPVASENASHAILKVLL